MNAPEESPGQYGAGTITFERVTITPAQAAASLHSMPPAAPPKP